jgi:hypothetical protein
MGETPTSARVGQPQRDAHRRLASPRLLTCSAALVLIAVTAWLVYFWQHHTPEAQLRAIDAARAIPDERNAALIYAQIVVGSDTRLTWADLGQPLTPAAVVRYKTVVDNVALPGDAFTHPAPDWANHPWVRPDYPDMADWLARHEEGMAIVRRGSELPDCVLPCSCGPDVEPQSLWSARFHQLFASYPLILSAAAWLDLGEGHTREALETARTLIRIGRHLQSQPMLGLLNDGIAFEQAGTEILDSQLADANAIASEDLQRLAAEVGSTSDRWAEICRLPNVVRGLYDRQMERLERRRAAGTWQWRDLWYAIWDHETEDGPDPTRARYNGLLTQRRLHCILIALRQFRDTTGRWPTCLSEVASTIPSEAISEFEGGRPIVQCLSDEAFVVYSVDVSKTEPSPEDVQVLVHQGGPLAADETPIIHRALDGYVEMLGSDQQTLDEPEAERLLRRMARYSVPSLLRGIAQENTLVGWPATGILTEFANKQPPRQVRDTSFLESCVSAFRKERDYDVKGRYLQIFAECNDVSTDRLTLVLDALRQVVEQHDQPEIRSGAAGAMLRVGCKEGLVIMMDVLGKNPGLATVTHRRQKECFSCWQDFDFWRVLRDLTGRSFQSDDALRAWWEENKDKPWPPRAETPTMEGPPPQ